MANCLCAINCIISPNQRSFRKCVDEHVMMLIILSKCLMLINDKLYFFIRNFQVETKTILYQYHFVFNSSWMKTILFKWARNASFHLKVKCVIQTHRKLSQKSFHTVFNPFTIFHAALVCGHSRLHTIQMDRLKKPAPINAITFGCWFQSAST